MTPPVDESNLLTKLRKKILEHKACHGYGYVIENGKQVMCKCRVDALYDYRLMTSGIPPKYRTKSFKDYVYKESTGYKQVQEYLSKAQEHRESGTGMFMYGTSFTGKSLLTCSLLMELMKKGYDCRFTHFDGLLACRDGAEKVYANQYDFLCIDGVGEVLNSLSNFRQGVLTGERIHGAVEFLSGIIAHRVLAGRPVIVTSTVELADVNKQFPGLASKLIGNCELVNCEDKGFKKRKLEQMMEGE